LSQNLKPFAGLSFGVVGEMNSVTQKEIINILESLGAYQYLPLSLIKLL